MDPAFVTVGSGLGSVAGPLPGEAAVVDSGREQRLADCESSGSCSSSDDDPYVSILSGRLADITSGASLSDPGSESASEPRCDNATIDAGCTVGRGSVPFAVGSGRDWDWD